MEYQIITQEDTPNKFPEGMRFCVVHSAQGELSWHATRADAQKWTDEEQQTWGVKC